MTFLLGVEFKIIVELRLLGNFDPVNISVINFILEILYENSITNGT